MKRNWKAFAVVMAAGALVLSACGGSSSSESSEAAPAASSAAPASSDAASDAAVDPAAATDPCAATHPAPPRAGGDKYIVYMTALNIGNSWQEEAENLGLAVGQMPPYNQCVEVRKELTEPDPQAQISQVQSMVAAGADGIISYALSPTAINSAYKDACDQGVTVIVYDATATEPCVYNVSYITSVPYTPTGELAEHPFMGYNAMAGLLELMGNTGDIFVSHGIVGTSTDIVHYGSALAALENSGAPTEILTEYEGRWDSAQQQKETTKALASFPDVAGIFCGYGEPGCVKALEAAGKTIPVSGETSNFFRLAMLDGWPGISVGSPPAQGGIAMKVMMHLILIGPDGVPKDIEVPYQIVTAENVKLCEGEYQVDGCNTFPEGTVGDENTADIFNVMLPEASLTAAKTGMPNADDVAVVWTTEELAAFEQDPSRRYITRAACPEGWTQGMLPENVEGCVQG